MFIQLFKRCSLFYKAQNYSHTKTHAHTQTLTYILLTPQINVVVNFECTIIFYIEQFCALKEDRVTKCYIGLCMTEQILNQFRLFRENRTYEH